MSSDSKEKITCFIFILRHHTYIINEIKFQYIIVINNLNMTKSKINKILMAKPTIYKMYKFKVEIEENDEADFCGSIRNSIITHLQKNNIKYNNNLDNEFDNSDPFIKCSIELPDTAIHEILKNI